MDQPLGIALNEMQGFLVFLEKENSFAGVGEFR